ncbi:hypothetical protein DPEC_G00247250 [Dallia pectoralis]|uniref:Uncharacterized protein n=1 Tax=Dallia pectoralis TaxID=75939 RepID=A0ACC2FWG2_DALPE|nr:hypothetical protein DPEC_G00247250 [Dallia pectoralis]
MDTSLIVTPEEQKALAMSTSTDRTFTPQTQQLTHTHLFTSDSDPGSSPDHSYVKNSEDGCLELLELEQNPQDSPQLDREVDTCSQVPIAPRMEGVLAGTPDVSLPECLDSDPVQTFCPVEASNEPDRVSSPSSDDTNNNGFDLNTFQSATEDCCPASNIFAPMMVEDENEHTPNLLVQSGAEVGHVSTSIGPGSISFSDYTSIPSTCNSSTDHSFDCSDSFSEENEEVDDDQDEDVFPEHQSRQPLLVWMRMSTNVLKNGFMSAQSYGPANSPSNTTIRSHLSSPSSCNSQSPTRVQAETNSMEPESTWCDSISQLMKKLDQLNLDIEETLSTSSSPSDTPYTARKHQLGAVSGATVKESVEEEDSTFLHQGGLDTEEWPRTDQDENALHSSTTGTRAETEKTVMCSKKNELGSALSAQPVRRGTDLLAKSSMGHIF